jgi:GntR family transcriptional regulator
MERRSVVELSLRLDRDAPEPLYAQVRNHLRRQILGSILAPGDVLPSELELQERFGVSRSVVRQALAELADAGLVHRQRGRGTVVAPLRMHHRRADQAGGLSQQLAAAGQQVRTHLLRLAPVVTPSQARAELDTDAAWLVERMRYVDEQPLAFMRTWLPRGLFPDLRADDLQRGSLLDYVRSVGLEPRGGPRQLQAVPADGEVAEQLRIAVGDPVLLLRAVTRDALGRCLEWASVWHPSSTVFDVEATYDPSPPGLDAARAHQLLAELRSLIPEV